jgi:hypothetical protein
MVNEKGLPPIYKKGMKELHGKVVDDVRASKGRIVITFKGTPLTYLEVRNVTKGSVQSGVIEDVYTLKPEIQRALDATTSAGRARGRKLYGIVYKGDPRPTRGEYMALVVEKRKRA